MNFPRRGKVDCQDTQRNAATEIYLLESTAADAQPIPGAAQVKRTRPAPNWSENVGFKRQTAESQRTVSQPRVEAAISS